MKYIFYLFLSFAIFTNCHNSSKESAISYDYEEKMEGDGTPSVEMSPEPGSFKDRAITEDIKKEPAVDKKKIIKEGYINIKVSNLNKTKARVDSIIKTLNGYYGNEQLTNNNYSRSYELNIRIPNQNFESLIKALESSSGEILAKNINAKDVTEQFVDLNTRLENKRQYVQRYTEILKQAKTINEILEIEEKIRGLEEEIESTEGRLKYLGDQVAYSTLRLEIFQEKEYKYTPPKRANFWKSIGKSLSGGWFGLLDFIVIILHIWPLWLILGIGFYFFRKYLKKTQKLKGLKKQQT